MARKPKGCTCAPCCQCGYAGQDSDGADCYGKAPSVEKPGVGMFYGAHCFCWHASEADCPRHGSPEVGEILGDLEPCPNAPYHIEGESLPCIFPGCTFPKGDHTPECLADFDRLASKFRGETMALKDPAANGLTCCAPCVLRDLWNGYGCEPDSALTADAIALRDILRSLVEPAAHSASSLIAAAKALRGNLGAARGD